MALVLPPQGQSVKTAHAKALEGPEVVELKHPAAGEHLESLLRERPGAVGKVMNGADGSVFEGQVQRHGVVGGILTDASLRRDRAACEVSKQVDKVAGLADDAASARLAIAGPMVASESTGIHSHHQGLRAGRCKQAPHLLHVRCETPVEPD